MASYPRYLTYKEGELEATLEQMGVSPTTAGTLRANGTGRKALLERHTCPVLYPDGATGVCNYTRCAPNWRVFRFEYLGADGKGTHLPSQRSTERIADEVKAVVAAAERLAVTAFREAITQEREYFRRATSFPGAHRTAKPQMKAKRAAQLAGKYALCQPLGENLLPVSETFETLNAANNAWEAQNNRNLVVACCNRFRRRWERLRYNALHARADYPALCPAPAVPSTPTAVSPTQDETGWEDEGDEEAMPGSDFTPEPEQEEE